MAVRIQFRRGTANDWSTSNPILALGELGYQTGVNTLIKFGDGVTPWNSLQVAAAGDITSVIAGTGLTYGPSTTGYGNAASAGFSGVVELGIDTSTILISTTMAKGDLLVGSAPNTYTKVSLPTSTSSDITNGKSLVADSTQSAGVAWKQVVPPGVIQQYAGTTAPAGYLMCNGGSFSSNDYGALATVVGDTYWPHSGTTYYLPDLRGKVPVGKAASGTFANLNGQGGTETVPLSEPQMPPHTHGMSAHTHGMGNHRHYIGHGHNHTITTSDSGHSHPASTPLTNNNSQSGYFYTRRSGVGGPNYDWSGAGLERWDAYQYPGTNSGTANVSIAGGVTDSTTNSGTPIASGSASANNNTDAPNGTGLTASAGGTSGTVVAHNNLQPYIVLNYIIKT